MLSVVIPVYNVKDYLLKCLESVASQTLDDLEVIVVDDGSNDGSEKIVDNYCASKENFKVFHKANGGLMSAWIYGVEKSAGDYIGFVDSDDYVDIHMFEEMYETARTYGVDIVMCERFDVVNGEIEKETRPNSELKEGLYAGDEIDWIKQRVFPLKGMQELTKARWNKIFKRDIMMSNLKYCECKSRTFEDRYITPPCIFSAKSFYYLPKPFYYYVHREGSNSGMYKPDLLEQIIRMYKVEEQALIDKNLMAQYGENWKYVFMDYIRQYVTRNILNVRGLKNRYRSAKVFLSNELVKERMAEYGASDKTKLGKAVYLAGKLHSPLFLGIMSYLR